MEALNERIFNSTDPEGLQARLTEFNDHFAVTFVDPDSGIVLPEAKHFPKSMELEAETHAISSIG